LTKKTVPSEFNTEKKSKKANFVTPFLRGLKENSKKKTILATKNIHDWFKVKINHNFDTKKTLQDEE